MINGLIIIFFRPENEQTSKELVSWLQEQYTNMKTGLPEENQQLEKVLSAWFQGNLEKRRFHLYTEYHEVEKMTNALAIKW